MKAPQIDRLIRSYEGGGQAIDEQSRKLLDQLFEKLNQIVPCGDDNRHDLWLEAPRGTIEDYGDYEYELENELVSNMRNLRRTGKKTIPMMSAFISSPPQNTTGIEM